MSNWGARPAPDDLTSVPPGQECPEKPGFHEEVDHATKTKIHKRRRKNHIHSNTDSLSIDLKLLEIF